MIQGAQNLRSDWNQLPQLWPQLESLEIGQCTGLTMEMVEELIPRFIKLRRICLPNSLMFGDLQKFALVRKIMEESSNRSKETVLIDSYKYNCFREERTPCSLVQVV